MTVRNTNVVSAQQRQRPWVAADMYVRLLWEPLRALVLDLELGGVLPFYRESFFFQPGVPIYEAPTVAAFGRIGAGVRFP